jgi:N-dimethylarginine dimethylaminohydrolase
MTPWGPVVAGVQTPPRRRDYAVVTQFFQEAGVPIWRWVTAGYFEGGDFVILAPGVALLGYSGTRSTREGAEQVQGWLTAEGWEVLACPIAPQFVHLDAVLVMLGQGLALVCEDALESYALEWLDAHGVHRLAVSYRECVSLGGNVVYLGEERIISMSQNASVNDRLAAEGFAVTAIDYDQFTLGGGGVHCSSHELRRLET